jgi:two-component system, OmpR family, sensor kinase
MTFRARLVVAFVSITIVTLGGTFTAIYLAVKGSELAQLDAALLAEAREEAAEIQSIGEERLVIGEGLGPTVDDIGPLTKYAALYEKDGEILDSTESFGASPPDFESLSKPNYAPFNLEGEEHLRGVLVPVPGSSNTLLLAAPRVHLEQDSRYLWRTLLVLLLVGGLVSFALASWVIRRLTDEHRRIASVVRRVADGDLTQRVAMSGTTGEVAQLASDIDEMIERLGLLLDSQKRFIAHASHEMRSPLSILYGELSHALRRPRTEDEYRAALIEAHDSARHLTALTDDLLALARLGSGEPRPTEAVRLREAVERAIALARRANDEREVVVCGDGEDLIVEGRSADVERMIANLVINALHHSPPGSPVEVRLEREPGGATLRVADHGDGVDPTEREKIFEPFYRGTDVRASVESGTGLGLAIARETARSMGGDVFVSPENRLTRGACFTVRLPLAGGAS